MTYLQIESKKKIIKKMHLLYVHFKGSGDVRGVELMPAAVEAFRVGVGSTGDCGLPRGNYGENKNKREGQTVS